MLIGIPLETAAGETRVAATPETVKKLKAQGHTLRVQSGAGVTAAATDAAYEAAGAEITDRASAFGCELVLKVRSPLPDELALMKPGTVAGRHAQPVRRAKASQRWPRAGLTASRSRPRRAPRARRGWTCCRRRPTSPATRRCCSPPTSYRRFMPMLMTAAGTVKAARVRDPRRRRRRAAGDRHRQAPRRGDRGVRRAARASRSRSNRSAPSSSTCPTRPTRRRKPPKASAATRGRCRRLDASARQVEVAERVAAGRHRHHHRADSRAARRRCWSPRRWSQAMKPGSVIVDMAVEQGGNCPLTEAGKTVIKHGVTIVGATNLPALVAADASRALRAQPARLPQAAARPRTASSASTARTTSSPPA